LYDKVHKMQILRKEKVQDRVMYVDESIIVGVFISLFYNEKIIVKFFIFVLLQFILWHC
jgi:hypothetical protein